MKLVEIVTYSNKTINWNIFLDYITIENVDYIKVFNDINEKMYSYKIQNRFSFSGT